MKEFFPHAARLRRVFFTPTVSHCSMATLIGLCVRVQLLRALARVSVLGCRAGANACFFQPARFKVDINVSPGSHSSEAAVNKQARPKRTRNFF